MTKQKEPSAAVEARYWFLSSSRWRRLVRSIPGPIQYPDFYSTSTCKNSPLAWKSLHIRPFSFVRTFYWPCTTTSENIVFQRLFYAAVMFVAVAGGWSRIIGPATTLSREGAPSSSEITTTIMPLLSNAAGMTDESVFVSSGTLMLFTPWKKTA